VPKKSVDSWTNGEEPSGAGPNQEQESMTTEPGEIQTGADYRESLRDGRCVYFNGERIEDVPSHPRFRAGVQVTASSYDREFERSRNGLASHSDAYPRTQSDLRAQIAEFTSTQAQKDLTWTGTYASLMGIESAASQIQTDHPTYAERIRTFVSTSRSLNRRCMPTITDAKGDRMRAPGEQDDPDQYLRIVDRNTEGIVVKGAKLHIRGASILHDLLVLPTKRMHKGEEDWAVAFATPVNAPGVKIMNSGWAVPEANWAYYPYSKDRTIPFGFVIFDDVFVPWEKVFLCGEIEFSASLVHTYGTWNRLTEAGMMASEADLYVGLGQLLAEANGVDRVWHIRDKLTELILNATLIRAGVEAAIANSIESPDGFLVPAELYTNVAKYYAAMNMPRMMGLLQDIAGGAIVNSPMPGDLECDEMGSFARKYMQGADDVDGEYRTRLMYGARDIASDWFSGYAQVLGLHGAGGPFAHRLVARKVYDIVAAKQHAREALGLDQSGKTD